MAVALATPACVSAAVPGDNGSIFLTASAPASPATDVWSVAADGSGLVDLTDLPGGPGQGSDPSVSVGGTVAFVVGTGSGAEIWTMGADGSAPRRLTYNSTVDEMPAVSPDGTRIAFVTDRGAGRDLWAISADGSGEAPLLTAAGDEEYPQYSPDGHYVVIASHVTGDLDIAYVPSSGGPFATATAITSHSDLEETAPALQPDQVRLGYTRYDRSLPAAARQRDIFISYYDGTDEYPVATDPAISEETPAYSPDGTRIAYATAAGLVVADAGGSNPAPLATPAASGATDPDWAVAPDSRPPSTTITRHPKRRVRKRSARFGFEAGEHGASFECRLDHHDYAACRSPRFRRRYLRGRHRFEVRAIDTAGNVDPTPAKARFRVLRRRH